MQVRRNTPMGGVAAAPSRRRRLLGAVAWLVVALAWAGALVGWVGPDVSAELRIDGTAAFVIEMVATMHVQGGVLAVMAVAALLLLRCKRPAYALLLLVLAMFLPELWARVSAAGHGLAAELDSPILRVATANLREENETAPAMAASLRELDADVLVLVEFTPAWERQLAPLAADYPHRWLAAPPPEPGLHLDGLRIAVWSRLAAAGPHEVRCLRGRNAQIRVPLLWQGRPFALYGVHPWKPYPLRLFGSAQRERELLLEWFRGEPLPTVIAGDCNASPRSAFFVRLRQLGLAVAAEAVCGRAPPTWPMDRPLLAPFRVAIDHVLHTEEFGAVGFQRGRTNGSDHAPVVASLVWRQT